MDDFNWSEVGQRLKDWRTAAGLTQRALADKVGLSQPAIQAIESGTCNPQLNSLQSLAVAFGKRTRELVCGQDLESDLRIRRLGRILCSGNLLAITAAEQGLTCAEALLVDQPRSFASGGRGLRRKLNKEQAERAKQFLQPAQRQSSRRNRAAGDGLIAEGGDLPKGKSHGFFMPERNSRVLPATISAEVSEGKRNRRSTSKGYPEDNLK